MGDRQGRLIDQQMGKLFVSDPLGYLDGATESAFGAGRSSKRTEENPVEDLLGAGGHLIARSVRVPPAQPGEGVLTHAGVPDVELLGSPNKTA